MHEDSADSVEHHGAVDGDTEPDVVGCSGRFAARRASTGWLAWETSGVQQCNLSRAISLTLTLTLIVPPSPSLSLRLNLSLT